MSKLSERAMIASLHIGSWSGMLLDKEVTEEVSESHRAERDAGRYNKQIVSRKFLQHVGSKISAARRTHRLLTLPWEDDGSRILSTMGYTHYAETMRLQRLGVEAAASEFVKMAPDYIKEAKQRLGTMFDNEDYPDEAEVRRKFYIDVEIKPVPEAGDFRAELSEASVKAIVKDIERRSDARIEMAMRDVYARIADVSGKMVQKLREYEPAGNGEKSKGNFHDTLVSNVKELADLLPSLNITGDPKVDKLAKQMLDDLVEHSPEVLKADKKARLKTADKAEAVFKKVSQYL